MHEEIIFFGVNVNLILKIGAAVFAFLFYWYYRPKQSPPGPIGFPIVGYLPVFMGRPEKVAHSLMNKYGSIVNIRIGPRDNVFLNDFDSINKVLVENSSTMSDRVGISSLTSLKKNHGIAFLDFGDKFKSQRKFGLRTLRGFGVGKIGMENICLDEMYRLIEKVNSLNGEAFDFSEIIHHAISNNICSVTLGKRFDYDDEEFKKRLHLITKIFDDPKLAATEVLTGFIPSLKFIPPFSFYHKKISQMLNTLFQWFDGIAKDHEKTFDENNLRDFIDAFIFEKKKGTDQHFTDLQLVHYIHDLLLAGTETTSSTICWALLCFLHYPQTQNKLRQEIFNVLGHDGRISMSKRAEMPYTNAFILEVLRFRPIGPLSVPHKAKVDTEIGDYVIRKDTKILVNIWAVHYDPKLWKNPEKFYPERFLDEKGSFINSKHVIPFSVGPRHCLGEQLARMELFIFIVGLVQKFEFLPDPGESTLPSIKGCTGNFALIPKPFEVVAKPL